jgi:adenine-specific DNA-methyltransferase
MHSFEKLKNKLSELFQLDQADLDFGIYRIMNMRRDEINRFMESDLLPQVREAFGEYKSSDKAEIQKELDKVVEGVEAAGMDPEQSPKVKELRERLAEEGVDGTALENEVYDHLYSFYSRYYDEGDFISLRRYKEGVYAIPYEGEEVKLHWANHDQYYIKTTEYFRDYAFKIPGGHRVHFKIVEADTEKDNIKAANGNDRRFLLHGDQPVVEENGELVIRFEYRADGDKRRQDVINADMAKRVIADLDDEKLAAWKDRLAVMWKRADGKESDKTILDKHLFDYTKRNTFDYFIHKDLEGFLRRELDFYIKNEVMRLDDIEEESAPRVEQYLSKIKVIRRIAHKIIGFLAQIENFQKKLWLKKKFVVETNYCVTLDRVPEELYPEIVANDAQREEWVRLFAIDEIRMDLAGAMDFSEPLTVEFLKANPFLVLDTKFFGQGFKDKLLASLDDIEGNCDGLLFLSENFQAIGVMAERYGEDIECIYIDPPYNTDASPILYKNGYRVSSWVSMMEGRLRACHWLLKRDAVLSVAIDDAQQRELSFLLETVFDGNKLGTICVRSNPSGRPMQTGYSVSHEYVLFAGKSRESIISRMPPTSKQLARFSEKDDEGHFEWRNLRREGSDSDRSARRHLYYPIYLGPEGIRLPKMDWDEKKEEWIAREEATPGEKVVYPDNEKGQQKRWRWSHKKVIENLSQLAIRRDRSERDYVYYKRRPHAEGVVSVSSWFDAKYSATEHGTALLKDLFGTNPFSYPKSLFAVCDSIYIGGAADDNATALDFFAGSGTTAHAVLHLNREDGGQRKYVLVEMGDYFDTVLKPRIQKVVYSKDWKDGKPVSREGISHMFKYIRLESYEDALANIELQRTNPQQLLLHKAGGFRESYMLKYMLDVESRGSQTLLNIDNFDDPWSYKLLVGAGSVGETKPVNVDLVETFNWLLGLKVKHIDRIGGFQVIEGENPTGEKVLVIWRKVRDLDETDTDKIAAARDQANRDLETFFMKQQYNTLDSEFDLIYVNGDNNLMNVPLDPDKEGVEPRYKVRLIEQEFKRLMFDVKEI